MASLLHRGWGYRKPPLGARLNCSHPLARGLAGCWLMNEGGGSTLIDSAYVNNGTLTNSPLWSSGSFGPALDFNGVNNYVDIGNRPELFLSAFSISAWVKRSGTPASQFGGYFAADYNSAATLSNYALKISGGQSGETTNTVVGFWENPTGTASKVLSTTVTQLGVWYHVVFTWDTSTRRLYLQGVEEATNATGQTRTDVGGNLAIGRPGSYAGLYFHGVVEGVCLYDRALSHQEIRWLYQEPFANFQSVRRVLGQGAAIPTEAVLHQAVYRGREIGR